MDESEPAPAEPKKAGKEKAQPVEPTDAGPKLPVGKLPLPTAACDVEYKKIVEQIAFSADA